MTIKKKGEADGLGEVLLIEFIYQKAVACLSCNKVVITRACIKTSSLGRYCCEDCFLNQKVIDALIEMSLNVSMA